MMQEVAPARDLPNRTILGVTIMDLSRDQAIAKIDTALSRGTPLGIGFANARVLNMAHSNDRFRSALRRFFVLNDGLGTDVASRLKFGSPFTENLNGTDFVPAYLRRTRHRLRIYLIGTTDEVVARAAQKLQHSYPQHVIVGYRNGFFLGAQDIEQTCCEIRAAHADCVLVGMGNPIQEFWIDEHGAKTSATLFFAVGALLDFEGGSVSRAPVWVRDLRCEWIFRLLQEPLRLAGRYLVGNIVFLSRILADVRS
jgi:alpha-1,3-mannosyltransferase